MRALMGVETEYALAVLDRNGKRKDAQEAAQRALNLAQQRFPHLLSADGQGIFLANGGKLYIDVGCHPEYATPECATPRDLVCYTLAGDRIMAQIARDLERSGRSRALVFRGNTGYGGQPESWACHESFLCRRPPAEYTEQIVGFLVSRMLFAGGGGFNPFSPGISFTLSPRSHFLTTLTNRETMHSRPVLNLRDEPLARRGWHRLHLICADALGSETALWLRAGVTALVIALLDAGRRPVAELTLKDPLAALRAFAADASLTATVPTTQGRQVTAIAIQRRYLQAAREFLTADKGRALADWAATIVEAWERVLDLLENEPEALGTALDWTIKRALYADFCESRGVPWDSLPAWTQALERLQAPRPPSGRLPRLPALPLAEPGAGPPEPPPHLTGFLEKHGLDWSDLPRIRSLREELFELEMRFLQIGGLFHSLDEQGVLDHRILSDARAVEAAVGTPPSASRAALRGAFVQQFAKNGDYQAGWTALVNVRTRQVASLEDPFVESVVWGAASVPSPRRTMSAEDRRIAALSSYMRGDYDEAHAFLQQLLAEGFERPSTYCHLARVALMTDRLDAAAEFTRRAWEVRAEAPDYVLPRIFWLQIALAMLGCSEGPLLPLVRQFRAALLATDSFEWTVAPVLNHLQSRLSPPDHEFLAAMADVISDHDHLPRLEAFPLWREASRTGLTLPTPHSPPP
ncbi:MAG TPA: proteasome accessory factor PafA2 family protein [Chthonomonadaceae bacterium]|nr:proteasome accessory factor PafA2 family protein [Chthonomonadaceae bacterium]